MKEKILFILPITIALFGCNNQLHSSSSEKNELVSVSVSNQNITLIEEKENIFSSLIKNSTHLNYQNEYTVSITFNDDIDSVDLSAGFFRNLDTQMCIYKDVNFTIKDNRLFYTFTSKNIEDDDVIHHCFKIKYNSNHTYHFSINYGKTYTLLNQKEIWMNSISEEEIEFIEYNRLLKDTYKLFFSSHSSSIKEKVVSFINNKYYIETNNVLFYENNNAINSFLIHTKNGATYTMDFDDLGRSSNYKILSSNNDIEELINSFYKEKVKCDVVFPTLNSITDIKKINIIQTTDDHNHDYDVTLTRKEQITKLIEFLISNTYQYDYLMKSNRDGGSTKTITIYYQDTFITIKIINECVISENNMAYTYEVDFPVF